MRILDFLDCLLHDISKVCAKNPGVSVRIKFHPEQARITAELVPENNVHYTRMAAGISMNVYEKLALMKPKTESKETHHPVPQILQSIGNETRSTMTMLMYCLSVSFIFDICRVVCTCLAPFFFILFSLRWVHSRF